MLDVEDPLETLQRTKDDFLRGAPPHALPDADLSSALLLARLKGFEASLGFKRKSQWLLPHY